MAKTKYPGIESYETAAGIRYRAHYRKPNGAQTDKRGFTTIRDARLSLASTDVRKAEGHYIDPRRGRVTIGELGEKQLAAQSHLKPSALRSVDSAWRGLAGSTSR